MGQLAALATTTLLLPRPLTLLAGLCVAGAGMLTDLRRTVAQPGPGVAAAALDSLEQLQSNQQREIIDLTRD